MSLVFRHSLRLQHRRQELVRTSQLGRVDPAESEVEVWASSEDLVESWRELLSRLPNDVYAALKEAMAHGQG